MCGVCDGWTPEELLQEHLAAIERHGWSHQMVEGDVTGPPFAYTIGLTREDGHPEVVLSGLPGDVACGLLHLVVDRVRAGDRLEAGTEIELADEPARLLRVRRPERLVVAQQVFGSPGHAGLVPALQLVWRDLGGRWPWERPWREARRVQELFGTSPWA